MPTSWSWGRSSQNRPVPGPDRTSGHRRPARPQTTAAGTQSSPDDHRGPWDPARTCQQAGPATNAAAISAAIIVVASELLTLAWLRHKFFQTSFARSFVAVTVGGAIIASLSAVRGVIAAG